MLSFILLVVIFIYSEKKSKKKRKRKEKEKKNIFVFAAVLFKIDFLVELGIDILFSEGKGRFEHN